jgi:PAS domain S-box-containing protein
MIPFQRMSIHNKLALALGCAALLAFAVTGVTLALFGSLTLERRARQIMEPYAQLVAIGAEAAVAFEDPERAREILATLRANPQILEAEIFLRDGRMLAGYNSRSKATLRPHPFKADGFYRYDNRAELIQRLHDDAHLRLVMSLDGLNRQTRNLMQLFGAGVLVLLLSVTLGLRVTLQRIIVRPISTLAETVEQVRSRPDYHQSVPDSGADEVARLGRSFNAMMGVIQAREDDLRRLTLFQRTILDNAAYGIVSVAPDGIISSFNPAAERLLGYMADEAVGKLTPACWHDPEEMARRALQLSEELDETVPPGFDLFTARPRRNLPEENEWTFIRKDGTRVPVLLSVTALRDESGLITGFVGLTYDLTERKRAEEDLFRLNTELEERVESRTHDLEIKRIELEESQGALINIVEDLNEKTEELEQANAKLKELDHLKSMFIASMSHELRTPLNSVIGFSSVLLNEWVGPVNAEQKENLSIILRSGKHLLNLINDVIDVSKIEAGKIESTPEEFDLRDIVFEAVSLIKKELEEKGLVLRVTSPSQMMSTDRRRLLQCLLNLLSNAVKFTDQGGVTVETRIVQVSGEKPEAGVAEISVTDTGIGIREEDIGKIFQPFVRLFSPLQSTVPGTGLGLYLTRKLTAEVLKGDIMLISEYGMGSRFTIKIPVGVS